MSCSLTSFKARRKITRFPPRSLLTEAAGSHLHQSGRSAKQQGHRTNLLQMGHDRRQVHTQGVALVVGASQRSPPRPQATLLPVLLQVVQALDPPELGLPRAPELPFPRRPGGPVLVVTADA